MINIVDSQDEQLLKVVEAVGSIEKETFTDAWSMDSIQKTIEFDYNKIFVIYNDSSDISGYLIANFVAGETELLRIAVKPEERGNGYGKLLIEAYISYAKHNCERGFLEVRQSNTVARGLYERLGYKEIANRKNYYHNPIEDGIIYEITFLTI